MPPRAANYPLPCRPLAFSTDLTLQAAVALPVTKIAWDAASEPSIARNQLRRASACTGVKTTAKSALKTCPSLAARCSKPWANQNPEGVIRRPHSRQSGGWSEGQPASQKMMCGCSMGAPSEHSVLDSSSCHLGMKQQVRLSIWFHPPGSQPNFGLDAGQNHRH